MDSTTPSPSEEEDTLFKGPILAVVFCKHPTLSTGHQLALIFCSAIPRPAKMGMEPPTTVQLTAVDNVVRQGRDSPCCKAMLKLHETEYLGNGHFRGTKNKGD